MVTKPAMPHRSTTTLLRLGRRVLRATRACRVRSLTALLTGFVQPTLLRPGILPALFRPGSGGRKDSDCKPFGQSASTAAVRQNKPAFPLVWQSRL